jgi:hypothetical protein
MLDSISISVHFPSKGGDTLGEYRVKIRGVEVIVDSVEALDEILDRYGGNQHTEAGSKANSADQPSGSMDKALLRRFIENANHGIASKQLQISLGVRGKALTGALQGWAEKVGLWHNNFDGIFKKNIYQGSRGYRLTPEAISAGKDILGMQ